MDILDFLSAANGIAQLCAADGQFLGLLTSNQYDRKSIINPNTYGSSYSYHSIQNPVSPYGGDCGVYSPYNLTCTNPPIILYQEQPVLVVTKKAYVLGSSLPIVDPDLMLGVYARHSYLIPHPAMASF